MMKPEKLSQCCAVAVVVILAGVLAGATLGRVKAEPQHQPVQPRPGLWEGESVSFFIRSDGSIEDFHMRANLLTRWCTIDANEVSDQPVGGFEYVVWFPEDNYFFSDLSHEDRLATAAANGMTWPETVETDEGYMIKAINVVGTFTSETTLEGTYQIAVCEDQIFLSVEGHGEYTWSAVWISETAVPTSTPSATEAPPIPDPTATYAPTPIPDTTAANENSGQIVFVSDRDGNEDIYTMNASGGDVRRLTDNPAADTMPAWSLDGTRIVFQSQRDGNWEIYIMNADGSGIQRVTNDPADDTEPLWLSSNTVDFLIFRSNRGGNNSLYTMSLDGSSIQPVTGNNFLMVDVTPEVLRFAYVQDDLWTFALDDPSSLAHRLTFQGGVSDPAWSPDGKHIAFGLESNADTGIYVIDYVDYGSGDGNLRELTPDTVQDKMPTWSPDGRQIAFVSEHDENPEIYVMDSEGGPAHRLTDNSARDLYPDWGPPAAAVHIPIPPSAPQAASAPTPIPPTPTGMPRGMAEGNAPFRGDADAPVVIVEFADFQCPYCGRWYAQTLPRILATYPDQVKFVYRHFTIFGDDSVRAAMAADCANDQGKFWEMHDRLFTRLENNEQASLSEDALISYAQELGLDTRSFGECLSSQKYFNDVVSDFQTAQSYGLQGTPGFVINGVVYNIGAQPFEVFDSIIKSELARVGTDSQTDPADSTGDKVTLSETLQFDTIPDSVIPAGAEPALQFSNLLLTPNGDFVDGTVDFTRNGQDDFVLVVALSMENDILFGYFDSDTSFHLHLPSGMVLLGSMGYEISGEDQGTIEFSLTGRVFNGYSVFGASGTAYVFAVPGQVSPSSALPGDQADPETFHANSNVLEAPFDFKSGN